MFVIKCGIDNSTDDVIGTGMGSNFTDVCCTYREYQDMVHIGMKVIMGECSIYTILNPL